MSNKKKFEMPSLHGIYYGYPLCCIAHYGQDRSGAPKEGEPFHGTGFIPCPECKKRPEADVLSEIAFNRQCSLPFPKEPSAFTGHVYQYSQMFFSGFLWQVLLYRSLSGKSAEDRLELLTFYAEFVRENVSKLLEQPSEDHALYVAESDLLMSMEKTVKACVKKHDKLVEAQA